MSRVQQKHARYTYGIIHSVIMGWVTKYEEVSPLFVHILEQKTYSTMRYVEDFLRALYGNECPGKLHPFFVPTVMLADKFLDGLGTPWGHVSAILLTSAVVTTKFLDDDYAYTNAQVADCLHFKLHELNENEIKFLQGIDYDIHFTQPNMYEFLRKKRIAAELSRRASEVQQSQAWMPCSEPVLMFTESDPMSIQTVHMYTECDPISVHMYTDSDPIPPPIPVCLDTKADDAKL